MFKTILMTAAATLLATAVAAPAHAIIAMNGEMPNGQFNNGIIRNGEMPNGEMPNGQYNNGLWENGGSEQGTATGAARFVIDGIELPARPL